MRELHIAGHEVTEDGALLIDDHGSPVAGEVWALLDTVIARTGPLPVLIERDNRVPALADLVAEARLADGILRQRKVAA